MQKSISGHPTRQNSKWIGYSSRRPISLKNKSSKHLIKCSLGVYLMWKCRVVGVGWTKWKLTFIKYKADLLTNDEEVHRPARAHTHTHTHRGPPAPGLRTTALNNNSAIPNHGSNFQSCIHLNRPPGSFIVCVSVHSEQQRTQWNATSASHAPLLLVFIFHATCPSKPMYVLCNQIVCFHIKKGTSTKRVHLVQRYVLFNIPTAHVHTLIYIRHVKNWTGRMD